MRAPVIRTRLFRQRLAAGLTQREVAERVGTTHKVIMLIEGRHKSVGNLRTPLAQELGVQAEWLFDDPGYAITERPVKFRPTPVQRKIVKLTKLGYSRNQIKELLDVTGFEVRATQRDAGLLPLYQGGGKP